MKGMVFTELLKMAESILGEDAVDEILDDLALENDGAYNAVGNYPCAELFMLVEAFGARLEISLDQLQQSFGEWMFGHFSSHYPQFFEGKCDALDMLDAIEGEVHVEVRKLYPNVELPTFHTERPTDGQLRMDYQSERPLIDFCHGLIKACVAHFSDPARVDLVRRSDDNGFSATFLVTKTT